MLEEEEEAIHSVEESSQGRDRDNSFHLILSELTAYRQRSHFQKFFERNAPHFHLYSGTTVIYTLPLIPGILQSCVTIGTKALPSRETSKITYRMSKDTQDVVATEGVHVAYVMVVSHSETFLVSIAAVQVDKISKKERKEKRKAQAASSSVSGEVPPEDQKVDKPKNKKKRKVEAGSEQTAVTGDAMDVDEPGMISYMRIPSVLDS